MTEAHQRLELEIPMTLPSAGNARHAHWSGRSKVTARQRRTVALHLHNKRPPELPADVLLIRVAEDELDEGDNLPASMKGGRDQVAEWLELKDDRDPSVRWCYGQAVDERRRPKYQALRIIIAERGVLERAQVSDVVIAMMADDVAALARERAKTWGTRFASGEGCDALEEFADDADVIRAALKGASK